MTKHVLSLLVEDKPGLLTRVAGLFARRGFNIESLAVGPTEREEISRMTVVAQVEDDAALEQIVKQLNKLINVIKIVEQDGEASVARELVLIKVKATRETRSDIVNVVNIFRANIVDVTLDDVVIELTGGESKIDALCEVLEEYGIIEIARTGAIALSRGPVPVKAM